MYAWIFGMMIIWAQQQISQIDQLSLAQIDLRINQQNQSEPILNQLLMLLRKYRIFKHQCLEDEAQETWVQFQKTLKDSSRKASLTPLSSQDKKTIKAILEQIKSDFQVQQKTSTQDQWQTGTLKVAVLLPLSGPYQALGQRIKDSILSTSTHWHLLSFDFADTNGSEDESALQADVLIAKGAHVILGPLGHMESETVAHRANLREVPMFYFASHPHLGENNSYVFRRRLDQKSASTLMGKQACSLGLQRVVSVGPKKDEEAFKAFFKSFAECQGIEHKAIRYEQLSSEVERVAKMVVGRYPLINQPIDPAWQLMNRKKKDPAFFRAPIVDFDAVFTTEKGNALVKLITQLHYWDLYFQNQTTNEMPLEAFPLGIRPNLVRLLGGLGFESAISGVVAPELFDQSFFVKIDQNTNEPSSHPSSKTTLNQLEKILKAQKIELDETLYACLEILQILNTLVQFELNTDLQSNQMDQSDQMDQMDQSDQSKQIRKKIRQILLNGFEINGIRGKLFVQSDGEITSDLKAYTFENGQSIALEDLDR